MPHDLEKEDLLSKDSANALAKDTVPAVSVIIPVYNVEKCLRESLNSVVSQTLREIEIICVNDGSTDSSLDILKEYAEKDPRVCVISQENRGVAAARNIGMRSAKGEFIAFLDPDDAADATFCERLFWEATAFRADVVECSATVKNLGFASQKDFAGQEKSFDFGAWEMKRQSTELFLKNRFHAVIWNKIYRREFLCRYGLEFNENLKNGSDAVFNWCVFPLVRRYLRLPDKLYLYNFGREGAITSYAKENRDSMWRNHLAGLRTLREFWTRHRLTGTMGHFLFSRAWKNSLWRITCFFGGNPASGQVFKEKMRDALRVFPELNDPVARDFWVRNLPPRERALALKILDDDGGADFIVSLTSYPGRIQTVNQAIETLLAQTWKADRVILWLAESQFPEKEKALPEALLALRERGLEIRWCEDLKSHKKLVPALRAFPEDVIITADDDLFYAPSWLEKLIAAYEKTPECITVHRAREVMFRRDGTLAPYSEWKNNYKAKEPSFNHFLVGVSGCAYPPHCLHEDVLNSARLLELCPGGDDIWFWAMAVLAGTKINITPDAFPLKYVPGTQENRLCDQNMFGGGNDIMLGRVLTAYPEVLAKLDRIYVPESKQDQRHAIPPTKLDRICVPESKPRKPSPAVPRSRASRICVPESKPRKPLPRILVRIGAMFILNKSARKRWRERHMDLTPRDGLDVKNLSAQELALRRREKRKNAPLRRLLDAIVPATRAKISHVESHLQRANEERTAEILAELRRSREELRRSREELKKQISALREELSARERETCSCEKGEET